MKCNLDFETRSRAELKGKNAVGSYKYADHPSTEVVCFAISDPATGNVLTWDLSQPLGCPAVRLLRRAIEEGWEIHAYNSAFEWAILKYVCPRQFGFPIPDINKLRCTMAVCRTAGLPPSLGAVGDFLKLDIQKDKVGAVLIQKFSKPQKDREFLQHDSQTVITVAGEKMTAETAFRKFVDYCAQDVRTEIRIAEVMKDFALKGAMLDAFLFDARMNDRGVPVDREALVQAQKIIEIHASRLTERCRAITGFNPSQGKRVMAWLKERGYPEDSLKKEIRDKYLDHAALTPEAREVLALFAELSFAAVKKVKALTTWCMSDGFIRGVFLWYGAQKTGRWTSKGPQLQNFKKFSKKLKGIIEEMYADVRNGMDIDILESFYGNPYEIVASLSRLFIRYPDRNVFDLDYSQVEAKILPMLIECQRILDRFGTGEDIYTTTYLKLVELFGRELDRSNGKVVVLATQFQGGWRAVFTATGSTWSRSDCEKAAAMVRKENPEFPKAWRAFQDGWIEAMQNPGDTIPVTKYVSYTYHNNAPYPRMLMNLPSGRPIVCPLPAIDPQTMAGVGKMDAKTGEIKEVTWIKVPGHRTWDELHSILKINGVTRCLKSSFDTYELSFWGHVKGSKYGRVTTYGGAELQSATQATGYDLLSNGCVRAERAMFQPFLVVHDQGLFPAIGDKSRLLEELCHVPDWFQGFPLDAEADEVRSYTKN